MYVHALSLAVFSDLIYYIPKLYVDHCTLQSGKFMQTHKLM